MIDELRDLVLSRDQVEKEIEEVCFMLEPLIAKGKLKHS